MIRTNRRRRNLPVRKSLASAKPDLAAQWHPNKNNQLTPNEVLPNSGKRFWWLCPKGHEWMASPNSRFAGGGCPFCAGKRACTENSLQSLSPDVASQWHPHKNGDLRAVEVTLHSNKRVWWICCKGHEWKTSVNNRASRKGCPYCAGNKVAPDTCLRTTHAALCKEWHPTKNLPLTPDDVSKGSHKRVWWICKRDHEWQAAVSNRSKGRGCPFCNSKTSTVELQLYAEMRHLFPSCLHRAKVAGKEADIYIPEYSIALEFDGSPWHRNFHDRDLSKTHDFDAGGVLLIRIRDEGLPLVSASDLLCAREELYGATIHFSVMQSVLTRMLESQRLDVKAIHRVQAYTHNGRLMNGELYHELLEMLPSPPQEDSLQARCPTVAAEWHSAKNGRLLPVDVSPKSHIKAWWRCAFGHEWRAVVSSRSNGCGCPTCANRRFDSRWHKSLAHVYPAVAAEWHPTKNGPLTPASVPPHFGKHVWWICPIGHEWRATVNNRVRAKGCPFCLGAKVADHNNLARLFPSLATEWHPHRNGSLCPSDVTPGSGRKVWWLCSRKHEWPAVINTRTKGSGCPFCLGRRATTDYCLAKLHPNIAAEWDFSRNPGLTPEQVTPASNKRVWWRCPRGHPWCTAIYHRTKGRGCPECHRGQPRQGGRPSNNTPAGICQPADGLPKPSV